MKTQRGFNALDRDGNGLISASELSTASSDADSWAMIREADYDVYDQTNYE